MYDARSEWREFIAGSRSEAVAKAASFFGASEDQLDVTEFPAGEVYGLGARVAVVAALKDRRPPAPSRGGDRGGDRGGERGGDRGGERDRGGRDRGGDRGGDRDRGRGGRRPEGSRGGEMRDRPAPVAAAMTLPPASTEASVGTAQGALTPIGEFVHGMLERMEVGPFEISETREGETIVVGLRGAAVARIAGEDARSIDALTLLANQALPRDGEENLRVVISAEGGGTDQREAYLAELAERAARRAIDTRRSVAIDPMSPKDRRIVHVALRELEGVVTMSVGSGSYRQVVVVPEGAPEYEEARRQAESTARSEG